MCSQRDNVFTALGSRFIHSFEVRAAGGLCCAWHAFPAAYMGYDLRLQ